MQHQGAGGEALPLPISDSMQGPPLTIDAAEHAGAVGGAGAGAGAGAGGKDASSSGAAGTGDGEFDAWDGGLIDDEQLANGQACNACLMRGLPTHAGGLLKLGGSSLGIGALKSWKDRWVVLDGPYLKYYLNPINDSEMASATPRGVLDLDGATVTGITHPKARSKFVFLVTTAAGRKEPFIADDEESFLSWVNAISGVIEVLAQFPGPRGRKGPSSVASPASSQAVSPRSYAGSVSGYGQPPPPGSVAPQGSLPPPPLPPGSESGVHQSMATGGPTYGAAPTMSPDPAHPYHGVAYAQPDAPQPGAPGYVETSTGTIPQHEALPAIRRASIPNDMMVGSPLPSSAHPGFIHEHGHTPPPPASGAPAVAGQAPVAAAAAAPPAPVGGLVCSQCATPAYEADARFCENCGTKLQ